MQPDEICVCIRGLLCQSNRNLEFISTVMKTLYWKG